MSTDPTDEIVALWAEVYGEPPTIITDSRLMLAALIRHLPEPSRPVGAPPPDAIAE
ncbi:MAG: hypothetical protein JSR45_04215 [Proteobacteria bacterium]|nr:hypothetical protein [Pseudomonadota bacterium]